MQVKKSQTRFRRTTEAHTIWPAHVRFGALRGVSRACVLLIERAMSLFGDLPETKNAASTTTGGSSAPQSWASAPKMQPKMQPRKPASAVTFAPASVLARAAGRGGR